MNHIYETIDVPIWIKNSDNNIVFLNEKFKLTFNIDEIKAQILKETKSNTYFFEYNEKLYKHIISLNHENNLMGMIIDVTDVREKYEEQGNDYILNTIIDNIPEIIFYKDNNLKYRKINKHCKKFYTERGIEDIIGKNDLELPLDEEFTKVCNEHDKIVLEKKETLYIEEKAQEIDNDEYTIFQTIKTPVLDEKGKVLGLVGVVRDITEQRRKEENLKYLSYTDALTGIYNRTYFDKILQDFKDKEYPLGIIIGDLDGLKIVNDTLGHLEGDKLIKSISEILVKSCIGESLVFRWGGDEFITLIPNATENDCKNYIKRVTSLCRDYSQGDLNLSISLGYSLLKKGNNIDKVIINAEEKLYKQKMINGTSIRGSILSTLQKTLELKNLETQEHTDRVAKYCEEIGKEMNLDEETIEDLNLAGKLHDIGKIGIPENILLKKDELNDEEYEIIKTHSEKGYRLAMLLPELNHIAEGILAHHEKWDGSGYPLGLSKKKIPLIARIVAFADSFDSMTNDRPYKKGMKSEEAIKELKKLSGIQFDPKVVEAFSNIVRKKNNI